MVLVGVYQPVLPIQSDILEELRGPEVSLALGFLGKWYEIVIFDSGVICNPMKSSDFSFFCGINVWYTPWKINMEPTNHPFRKENDLPNLHDYVPC